MASSSLITFRTSSVCSFYLILLLFWSILPIVLAKSCKKIDNCKCEMDDGSGTISLWDINNPDGTPRFKDIPEQGTYKLTYTFLFNPCTPLKSSGKEKDCAGSNLCQKLIADKSAYYPCDESDPTFSVDNSGHVVMTYKTKHFDQHYRYSNITLICDEEREKPSFGKGVREIVISSQTVDGKSEYAATLSAKAACPVSSNLSVGSIILIVFFPLVLLYLIIGILFNIYVRHQKSVPEVLPNHTFWAAFPFLVKDGCVFSCGKMKYCCQSLFKKARGEEYTKI